MTRRTIIYSSPYVPSEWIEAHGLVPCRFEPSASPANGFIGIQAGVCPFMAAFMNGLAGKRNGAGVILTTACDQFRRAFDLLPPGGALPVFLMNMPATWQSAAARDLYADEVRRLGCFLESAGGQASGDGDLRAALLRRETRDARHRRLERKPDVSGAAPVAVIGGPMTRGQRRLLDWIGELGGRVAVDGTEAGSRTRPAPVDRDRLRANPFDAMLDAYGAIPDVFRRPNGAFYDWLARETAGVRGVIVLRQVWCDLWHAEVGRIRERSRVPVLDLDMNEDRLSTRLRLRLEAFMEVIR